MACSVIPNLHYAPNLGLWLILPGQRTILSVSKGYKNSPWYSAGLVTVKIWVPISAVVGSRCEFELLVLTIIKNKNEPHCEVERCYWPALHFILSILVLESCMIRLSLQMSMSNVWNTVMTLRKLWPSSILSQRLTDSFSHTSSGFYRWAPGSFSSIIWVAISEIDCC